MPKQKQKQKQNQKPHLKLHNGHVAFRLLCHHNAGFAVIGRGGSTIQKIRRETGVSVLHVEEALPETEDMIVYIVGPGKLDRTLVLENGDGKYEVSVTQEALVRVLAVVDAEFTAVDERCVRLLTVKGEEKVKMLGEFVCGAVVTVLPMEELPLCADLSDDLIQITGDLQSVRKAVLAVTYCLQGYSSRAMDLSKGSVSYRVPDNLPAQKHPGLDTYARDGGQSHVVVGMKKVTFSLLCPTHFAGGLIGWKGSIIKAIEKDTGALIQVTDPVVGCAERVIVVSAMEKKEVQSSPAQDATLRVFFRSLEVAQESGHASGSGGGESVIARLLVSLSQANKLNVGYAAGVQVQILDSSCNPAASGDEKVIQIVGEPTDVQTCLLQITWALRENMFSSKQINRPLLPHELYGRPPHVHAATTITDEMDSLTISRDNSFSPTNLSLESSFGHTPTAFTENQGHVMASSSSSELGSGDECSAIKTEVEVVVPVHEFDQVYGEAGRNIALLRQISGATVMVHHPCFGTDGKVIICGTPNQIKAAKSVLYAFTMTKYDSAVIK